MSDEDKIQERISAGARATALVQNDAFTEATTKLRQRLFELWESSKDPVERERIWLSVNILEQIKGVLRRTIDNGTLAQIELDELLKGPNG